MTEEAETRHVRLTELSKAAEQVRATYYDKSWALVIGINDYGGEHPMLANARNDAVAFADLLRTSYHFEQVFTLYDEEATCDTMMAWLRDRLPSQIDNNDRLVLFFAGHGTTRESGLGEKRGYLIPHDAKAGKYADYIDMSELRDACGWIKAKHILLILDCCFSGVAAITSRAAPSIDQRVMTDRYLQEITRRSAWQVLTAGASDELAADSGNRPGHSAFTSALLAGLEGQADQNSDGIITASELAGYVKPEVSRQGTGPRAHQQTPFFNYLSGSEQGDFVFLRHDTEIKIAPSATTAKQLVEVTKSSPLLMALMLFLVVAVGLLGWFVWDLSSTSTDPATARAELTQTSIAFKTESAATMEWIAQQPGIIKTAAIATVQAEAKTLAAALDKTATVLAAQAEKAVTATPSPPTSELTTNPTVRNAVTLINEHYSALALRDYEAAYQLLTDASIARQGLTHASWAEGYRTTRWLIVDDIIPVSYINDVVKLQTKVHAADDKAENGILSAASYEFTHEIVREDGRWRINRTTLNGAVKPEEVRPEDVVAAYFYELSRGVATNEFSIAYGYYSDNYQRTRTYAKLREEWQNVRLVLLKKSRLVEGNTTEASVDYVVQITEPGNGQLVEAEYTSTYHLIKEEGKWTLDSADPARRRVISTKSIAMITLTPTATSPTPTPTVTVGASSRNESDAASSNWPRTIYKDCPSTSQEPNAATRETLHAKHSRLYIGAVAKVLSGAGATGANLYRTKTYDEVSGRVAEGDHLLVLEGPACVKGQKYYYQRWRVRTLNSSGDNIEGWTSEGGLDVDNVRRYWLAPVRSSEPCIDAYPSRIQMGDWVYPAFDSSLSLRAKPMQSTASLREKLPSGERVQVVDGPVCDSGWIFWQIRWNELTAWASEGDLDDTTHGYWLIPVVSADDSIEPAESTATTPPSAVAATPAINFEGEWATNFAQLTITQEGSVYTGIYRQYGDSTTKEFVGEVTDRTLKAALSSGTTVELTMNEEDNSFQGWWRSADGSSGGDWCGVRSGQPLPNGCGFSGVWQTNQTDNSWLQLEQLGTAVTGSYFNGETEGTIQGRLGDTDAVAQDAHYSLFGSYQEPDYSGNFRLDLLAFGSERFQGCWEVNGVAYAWCGWREGESAATSCQLTIACP